MSGFGKFYSTTFDGSMYGAGLPVFAVWAYVIANTGADHLIELNPKKVADALGGDEQQVRQAIEYLCSPDPDSRNPEYEGRRLVHQTQFKYYVPSHANYRDNKGAEDRREYMRQYMRNYRQGQQADGDGTDNDKAESPPPEPPKEKPPKPKADKPADKTEKPAEPAEKRFKFHQQCQLPADFEITPMVRQWCAKNQHKPRPEDYLQRFMDHFKAKGTRWKDWDQAFINWIREELPGGKFYKSKPGQPDHVSTPPPKRGNGKTPEQERRELYSAIRHAEYMKQYAACEEVAQSWQKRIDESRDKLNKLEH